MLVKHLYWKLIGKFNPTEHFLMCLASYFQLNAKSNQ